MKFRFTKHATERMQKYGLTEKLIKTCVKNPSLVIEGKDGRKIAQKRLNGYVLRVIYEEINNTCVVITTYKARSERYEI